MRDIAIQCHSADSGYIVCGTAITTGNGKDIYLLKLNSSGDTVWTKTIGGSGDEEAYSVKECKNGGYIIAGYTSSYQ